MLPVVAVKAARRAARRGLLPDFKGSAPLFALGAVVAVPAFVALSPAWLRRWLLPMLAVTSMGVYATVPDTEHVSVVMLVVVAAAIVTLVARVEVHPAVGAAIAFVIVLAALADSAGLPAPIVRAIGCFAAFLAVPVAARLRPDARPALLTVLVTHGVVAVFASRALIRERSALLVVVAVAVALAIAVAVLARGSSSPETT